MELHIDAMDVFVISGIVGGIPPWISMVAKVLRRGLSEDTEEQLLVWGLSGLAVVWLALGFVTSGSLALVCGVLGLLATGLAAISWSAKEFKKDGVL
jgi:FtsH-binding integral membrane protein